MRNINMSILWYVVLAFAIFYFLNIGAKFYKLYKINSLLDKIHKIKRDNQDSVENFANNIFPLAPEINDLTTNIYAYISRNGGEQAFIDSFNTSVCNLHDLDDFLRYQIRKTANPIYSLKLFVLFILRIPSYLVRLFGFNINIRFSKVINAITWLLLIILDIFITHFIEQILNQFMSK